MKKTFLSIALVIASMAGITTNAQTPGTTQSCKAKTECIKNCQGKDTQRCNPFAGLNLTEKQQAELQALRQASKDARLKDGDKKDRSKGLSKAERQAQRKQMFEQRLQNRRDYLGKVKNILTHEQYMQFLENNYVEQGGMKPGQSKMAKHGKRQGGKAHAMRGDKARKDGQSRKDMKGRKPASQGTVTNGQSASNSSDGSYYIDNGLVKVFPYHAQK